jgi:hypothetical protein
LRIHSFQQIDPYQETTNQAKWVNIIGIFMQLIFYLKKGKIMLSESGLLSVVMPLKTAG